MAKKDLTPKSQDMSRWYTDVIQKAKMADYSPVRGCMIFRPLGYGVWEHIQKAFDPMLKELGIENAYFPLFIPMSFLKKEKEHVEGFSPELAVVTIGGGEKLEEELVVRPTSETIMYDMYSKWVQSYRDLPILINQWNNVVRWEKRTHFFLRTTEFLWQEAHTAHATHEEAWKMVLSGLNAYQKLAHEWLAVPVITGLKSESEKFAGGLATTAIEAMMPDGKGLQAGTSHDLGQNFSNKDAFNIAFQDEKGETAYAWQVSFGLSTRMIGAIIMLHGDDDGLVLPPKIAPTQVVILPVDQSDEVLVHAKEIATELKNNDIRVKLVNDSEHSLGWRLNDAELQGTPLTIVIGKKEVAEKTYTVSIRRSKEKVTLTGEGLGKSISGLLEKIHTEMFETAKRKQDELLTETESYEEFKTIMETKRGFIKAYWCEDAKCEAAIKEETKATTRCLPFIDAEGSVLEENGVCIKCGKPATHRWLFAQAY